MILSNSHGQGEGPVSGAIIRVYLWMGGAIKRTLSLFRGMEQAQNPDSGKIGAIKMGEEAFLWTEDIDTAKWALRGCV